MIKDEIISKRYADAFLAYARETVGFDRGMEELQSARRIFTDHPELEAFLTNIEIGIGEKHKTIDAVFTDGYSSEIRNFIKLLTDKRRIRLFHDIAEYARVRYAHHGESEALLKTSYPLDTDTLGMLKSALERRLGKPLHMYVDLDSELAGGVSAKIGNIVIDGSVRKRLEDLKDKLKAMKVA